jgi:phage host-nuclease inhibitor protein Gam
MPFSMPFSMDSISRILDVLRPLQCEKQLSIVKSKPTVTPNGFKIKPLSVHKKSLMFLFVMKKRIRITDRKSLEKAVSLYAKAKSNRVSLNNAMEEQLMIVRNNYTDRINECDEECESLSNEIIDYTRKNRETVFPKGVKHIELIDGSVGFKQGRNSLALCEGQTWPAALEAMQNDKSAKAYIRTKYEIDKARLIADRNKPKVAQILDRIGLQIINTEQFYIETKSI